MMNNLYEKTGLAVILLSLTTGISLAALQDAVYTFYPSGNLYTKELLVNDDNKTPLDQSDDIPSGTVFMYDDTRIYTDFNNYGHLIKHIRPDQSYRTFDGYYDDVHPRFITEYSATGSLIVAYEYDSTGHLIKRTNPDGSFTAFEEHFSADHARFRKEHDTLGKLIKTMEYSASPYRLIKETSATANANCEVFYTYSWDDTAQVVTKHSYTHASGDEKFFFAKYQYNYNKFYNMSPAKNDDASICRPEKQTVKDR